ncbi:hypothetical protein M9H77_21630 [Catharanthus roseus]|uniref:Uncharacterized protein n=1 Tax=Catharanthus roseus TaxID=4058 RepID=A0ACC0AMU9_CATRO|nr:hypothetical protein M9H77_21630 [Catharanthus roseus]
MREKIVHHKSAYTEGVIVRSFLLGFIDNFLGLVISTEAQLPTHYNEGTSGSSHSNLDLMKGYGNFSPYTRTYEHNYYDCYKGNRFGTKNGYNDRSYKRVPRNEIRNEGNYVTMDGRFYKRRGDYEKYYDNYYYRGYSCGKSSQILGTTSRPPDYNNLKLPLLCGNFGPYDYEAENMRGKNSILKKQIKKYFKTKKENGIKTNQDFELNEARIRCEVESHEGLGQGQAKAKFKALSKNEESPKNVDPHVEEEELNEEPCYIMSEKSIEIKERDVVEEKERLVEKFCIFDSISIFSKESEHFESSKEKEDELEKNSSKNERGKLAYKSIKTINVFTSNSYLSFEIYFKEIKLFSLVFMENGNKRQRKKHRERAQHLSRNLPMRPFLNPSLSFHEVSFEELKSLLVSYSFHVDIVGDICVISFDENFFLLVHSMLKCLSFPVSHEDLLMSSGVKFCPSCYGFGVLDDTSLVDPNIVDFELDWALFDILHDEYLGKFIKDVDYVFPFLDAFMKNLDGVILLNQCFHLLSNQVEFFCNELELLNVIESLNSFLENKFGFKFYHLNFKDFLLKDFENQMGAYFEMVKVNPLAFENSILGKEAFEHICKYFVVEHLNYRIPFKDWF